MEAITPRTHPFDHRGGLIEKGPKEGRLCLWWFSFHSQAVYRGKQPHHSNHVLADFQRDHMYIATHMMPLPGAIDSAVWSKDAGWLGSKCDIIEFDSLPLLHHPSRCLFLIGRELHLVRRM